ncbi:guanylate kinase [Lachnospiraceae bacterium NSJ-143]|nr:guanylate kinase [Lachnospiraceae bacterium NSJ-143]
MTEKGILIIISGPSGSGKGTVVEKLKGDSGYALSISATTRPPRPYEQEGTHYFFKSEEEFKEMINSQKLLEWAEFCGNFYGTPKDYVMGKLDSGCNVILEIEVQGAFQVKKMFPEAVAVFLIPPDRQELKKRLSGRGTEDSATIEKRLKRASEEIELLPKYDYVVVNDEVEKAAERIKEIVRVSKMASFRYIDIINNFK